MKTVVCWKIAVAVCVVVLAACKAPESPPQKVAAVKMTPEQQQQRLEYMREVVSELPIHNKKWDLVLTDETLVNLYVLDPYVFVETDDRELFAIDSVDGTVKWVFTVGTPLTFPPCLNNEDVFFISNDILFRVDRLGGNLIKKTLLPISPSSPPTASEIFLFTGSWRDARVYCFEIETFDIFQVYRARDAIVCAPVVVDTSIYFCSEDGSVYAFDIGGDSKWKYPTDSAIVCAPVRMGDRLYVGSTDHALYCLDIITGKALWKFETGGPITNQPQVTKDTVYVKSDVMGLWAVDVTTEKERWRLENADKVLLVGRKHVYVIAPANRLLQVSKETGEVVGCFCLKAFHTLAPTPDLKRVYFGTKDAFIFALEEPE